MIKIVHRIDDPYELSDEEFFKKGCEAQWFIEYLAKQFEAASMNVMGTIFAKT